MEGTGLKNILETVYGKSVIVHIMTGKAVQRTLRGHFLVGKCLHSSLYPKSRDSYTSGSGQGVALFLFLGARRR
ncbi:hypothetical protein DPMN_166974 [Dreissena polymorpha]|uniref:Uncharacterized protein n=1 Tax=Dreissena polymorpha TaxID=45954 RepID=A0A9D4IY41_DREPO|nr:hypothetical protein DPMN_166974 [Dreissena polymorpha]